VSGISIDTRSLQPGDAFFAIRGDTHDGHDFATAAIKAGVSVLVVAQGKLPALGRLTAPLIVVPDVLAALERLAAASRKRSSARIIAVTGSVGKTSTKDALRHVLASQGGVHASDKSFNNHWGVPLTLARMPADCRYGVFEIGMNHEGEIRPLVKLVRPHVGMVTMVAAAHLGHFASLDDIARAKAEIFEGVEPGGAALINRDDPRCGLLGRMAKAAGVETVRGYGEHERATYRLTNCSLQADHSLISASIRGREVAARIGVPGRHVVQNALGVLGAVDLLGADVEAAARSLSGLTAGPGRGRRHVLNHPGGEFVVIDESYNANPASMKAALALLGSTPVPAGGRRIAVLGDMLELGRHSAELHRELAGDIEAAKADLVLLAGPEMKWVAETLPEAVRKVYRSSVEELKPVLLGEVGAGDVVMIKSSKAIGLSQLVEALIDRFPVDSGQKSPS
jgi:UDP-N-acetylmuramoyl-tripeptide--D-alanyl-D-alanine ligase